MELQSTPRMPPFRWTLFFFGAALVVLEYVMQEVWNPSPGFMLAVFGAIYAAILIFIVGRRGVIAWRVRRVVHLLRRFDTAQRTTLLARLDNQQTQAYFEYRLADHGAPETLGLVERFAFSPIDRREATVGMWGATLAAIGIALPSTTLTLSQATRAISICCVLMLIVVATMLRRVLSRLHRVFEVSPFGLSEIATNGTVRRLLWGYGLTVRNRPWLRRIELSPASDPAFISIPYTVVGFDRLLELILQRGGFTEPA